MSSSFFSSDVASWWLKDEENNDGEDPFKSEENEKDCTIFVVDCNELMFTEEADEKSSSFSKVCKAIENTLKRKIIKSRDDLVCFILFNVLETNNAMKLDNIYLLSEPDCPSAKLIKTIRDLPSTFRNKFNFLKNDKECDFRDLLWTLQSTFSEVDVKGTKYGSKRAFIFTNKDNPKCKDMNATIQKAKDMLESGMEISVFPLSENFKIKTFYGEVCTFNLDELSTESQFKDVCPTLDDLSNDLRVKEMKKRSTVSCPLTIGPNFKMAVKMYSLYRPAKKESPSWLDARTNQPLTTETRWICGDTGQILDDSQIRTYHEYGPMKAKIYFTKAEMKEIKTFGDPSLTLMGFKPLDRLKLYYQLKPSSFVYPDEQRCNGSTVSFHALLKAMSELKQFAVCRYIARKQSEPRFVALIAQRENKTNGQPPGMNMIYLPYADDIRRVHFDGIEEMKRCDVDQKEDEELVKQAKNVLAALTYDDMPEPSNPVLQKHYDALEALALEFGGNGDDNQMDDDEEGVFEDDIAMNDEEMINVAGKQIDDFLAALEIKCGGLAQEEKPKRGKRKAAGDGSAGTKAKKRKLNVVVDSNLDWRKLAQNDELGSLKVKDLKVYLANNGLKKTGKKAELVDRIKGHLGL